MGFGLLGLAAFQVKGSRFRVTSGFGFGFWVLGCWPRRFEGLGLGFGVIGLGVQVQGLQKVFGLASEVILN